MDLFLCQLLDAYATYFQIYNSLFADCLDASTSNLLYTSLHFISKVDFEIFWLSSAQNSFKFSALI